MTTQPEGTPPTPTLREALEPFARMADAYDHWSEDAADQSVTPVIYLGQLRAARRALAAPPVPQVTPPMSPLAKFSPLANCDCGLMVETHTTLTGKARDHKPGCASLAPHAPEEKALKEADLPPAAALSKEEVAPPSAPPDAPAPGDAEAALALWHRINQGLCGPVAFREALRCVRAEERERAGVYERERLGNLAIWLIEAVDAYEAASVRREHLGAYGIRIQEAAQTYVASIRARASDATTAGVEGEPSADALDKGRKTKGGGR